MLLPRTARYRNFCRNDMGAIDQCNGSPSSLEDEVHAQGNVCVVEVDIKNNKGIVKDRQMKEWDRLME